MDMIAGYYRILQKHILGSDDIGLDLSGDISFWVYKSYVIKL